MVDTDLPNPGSGLEVIALHDGRWATAQQFDYPVLVQGSRLTTFDAAVPLEDSSRLSGQTKYPVIQFEDGSVYREESRDMAATIKAGLLDVKRGVTMFREVNVPVLGVVENMSVHVCGSCGHRADIFGSGGAEKMGRDYEVEVLGSLPLDIRIREQADSGKPTVVTDPEGPVAAIYRDIARKVAARIARAAEDRSSVFPKIVIQNN